MTIRAAHTNDLQRIMQIYTVARDFMQRMGNDNQWINGYPAETLIVQSIQQQKQYVCLYEGQIVGTFYFAIEDDATYSRIDDGQWLNEKPYGVVHRLASGGDHKGIAAFCLQWCFEKCHNVRVDTHRDNIIMQYLLKKNGYTPCGIIYTHNGTARLAFHKC